MKAIGFTGTRNGCTGEQEATLKELLIVYRSEADQFHHGDCVGADCTAHKIALELEYNVYLHPPTNPKFRAFVSGCHVVESPKTYLVRNRIIVDRCFLLIATPSSSHEQLRSGTWATVRYARQQKRMVHVILPDGDVM